MKRLLIALIFLPVTAFADWSVSFVCNGVDTTITEETKPHKVGDMSVRYRASTDLGDTHSSWSWFVTETWAVKAEMHRLQVVGAYRGMYGCPE